MENEQPLVFIFHFFHFSLKMENEMVCTRTVIESTSVVTTVALAVMEDIAVSSSFFIFNFSFAK